MIFRNPLAWGVAFAAVGAGYYFFRKARAETVGDVFSPSGHRIGAAAPPHIPPPNLYGPWTPAPPLMGCVGCAPSR